MAPLASTCCRGIATRGGGSALGGGDGRTLHPDTIFDATAGGGTTGGGATTGPGVIDGSVVDTLLAPFGSPIRGLRSLAGATVTLGLTFGMERSILSDVQDNPPERRLQALESTVAALGQAIVGLAQRVDAIEAWWERMRARLTPMGDRERLALRRMLAAQARAAKDVGEGKGAVRNPATKAKLLVDASTGAKTTLKK